MLSMYMNPGVKGDGDESMLALEALDEDDERRRRGGEPAEEKDEVRV